MLSTSVRVFVRLLAQLGSRPRAELVIMRIRGDFVKFAVRTLVHWGRMRQHNLAAMSNPCELNKRCIVNAGGPGTC
jgi:hypothetical protein